jgi:hypothetical protein
MTELAKAGNNLLPCSLLRMAVTDYLLSMEAARRIPLLQAKPISNKYMMTQQTRITWSVL